MSEPRWPTNKTETLQHLDEWWTSLQQTLDGWSDEQMTQRQDQVGWTVKDHLSHLIPWEQGMVALLRKQPRYEAMGFDIPTIQSTSEDELNTRIRERYVQHSLADVRAELKRTHEELVKTINSLSDEDMLRGYSYFQPNEPFEERGVPILRWVVGNSSGHYMEHLPWIKAIAEASR